jgi:hypothetical protein
MGAAVTGAVAMDTIAPPMTHQVERTKLDTPPAEHRGGTLAFTVLAVVAIAVLFVFGWNLTGGSLQVMETSSMCPKVCVGSLVASAPLSGPLHVGEFVTFHPPGSHGETYTHEVARIFSNGTIQTRGVGNPHHDPWLITRSDIVGEVVFTLWGVGWLLKALPLFAVGVLAWVVTTPMIAPRSRRAWDRIWMTVLAVVPLWMLHPLIKATVISTVGDPQRHRWQRITVVNTGLLPSSFRVIGGNVTSHVSSTHLARAIGPSDSHGVILVSQSVSLYWWGWVIVACMVSLPLVGFLWHTWRNDEILIPAIPA